MSEPICSHPQPSPIGCIEGPVQRADASVAGLVLFAGVHYCPECRELVVSAHLRPKTAGSSAVLVTAGFTALAPVAVLREVPRAGRGVRRG